ncbi:MAG: hypothetical protein J5U16_00425 [Candidatus Methanoperedens sp.]|nr:hypothetical protein [Candidatus Methanoperedens sp.]
MKKLNEYILSILMIVFLIIPAYGYPPGMGGGTGTINNAIVQSDPGNMTSSDQDIRLLQHLVEVDSIQLSSENKLLIHETLIFKNTGVNNFSGILKTWVPDGIEGINITRMSMIDGSPEYPLQPIQNGNIIEWQDIINSGNLPPLYSIEYALKSESTGKLTGTQTFTKKLAVPTIINYNYEGKPGLPAIVIKVTGPAGSSVELLDGNGNKLTADNISEDGNSKIYRFGTPQFKEVEIQISRSSVSSSQITGYVIIGILILLVISYPILRKKSKKIKGFEEKFQGSLKGREEKGSKEETSGDEVDLEATQAEDDTELSTKTKEELVSKKNDLISRLEKLKKDYADGNLMDEEYEELRIPYQRNLKKINRILEKME